MQTHALVDWATEPGLADRPVDDWTAGDEPDFTVAAPRRKRITDTSRPSAEASRARAAEPHARSATAHMRTAAPDSHTDAPRARTAPESAPLAPAPALAVVADAPPAPAGRRTVAITGRPETLREVPRLREIERRRRPARGPAEIVAARPDRIAMWAVALGFVLILIASLSG